VQKISAFLDGAHVPSPNWTRPEPGAAKKKKTEKKKG
jgi:hypothetical protein